MIRIPVARMDLASDRERLGLERKCSNCISHINCWRSYGIIEESTPDNFAYREGWNNGRFQGHLKGIFAQICNNFETSRTLMVRTREDNDWNNKDNN